MLRREAIRVELQEHVRLKRAAIQEQEEEKQRKIEEVDCIIQEYKRIWSSTYYYYKTLTKERVRFVEKHPRYQELRRVRLIQKEVRKS